jgi:hypothetical protein
MPGREDKYPKFKLGYNFSNYLWLGTHYDSSVLTVLTTITAIHFVLCVVSAEFQTNRSEARH